MEKSAPWIGDEHQVIQLHDDVSTELDLAMLARREGISAKATPDGILTRFANTTLGGSLTKSKHALIPERSS